MKKKNYLAIILCSLIIVVLFAIVPIYQDYANVGESLNKQVDTMFSSAKIMNSTEETQAFMNYVTAVTDHLKNVLFAEKLIILYLLVIITTILITLGIILLKKTELKNLAITLISSGILLILLDIWYLLKIIFTT